MFITRTEEDVIEELTNTETGKNGYLPNHAVICEDKITQCRGTYVNQHLHVGTCLKNDLTKLLIRFQRLRLALKADISKINTSTTSKSCFALSRSPCFATCVNRNHERKYQFPEAVNEILKNVHVDDLVLSIHEEKGFKGGDTIANSDEVGGFQPCKMCHSTGLAPEHVRKKSSSRMLKALE
ncbi:hypothetical protein T01_1100 [Trichinella spiralis]|uniref:Uncharacterized protein n=1 Tax=Trichinella spiralis TaxID=6334 RepID=A0A0V1BA42_TRISP|nr:hypothetical protein T01_1100 [Trichinella spiralis]